MLHCTYSQGTHNSCCCSSSFFNNLTGNEKPHAFFKSDEVVAAEFVRITLHVLISQAVNPWAARLCETRHGYDFVGFNAS